MNGPSLRVAVIGAGVSGLSVAYRLKRRHDVTVFESRPRPGGHARTLEVDDGETRRQLDVGFLVYNELTYPRFTRLLDALGVQSHPSEMSFSVQCARCALEYGGSSLGGLLAQPSALVRSSFYRLLRDIVRFNRWARRAAGDSAERRGTLVQAVRDAGLSEELLRHYLLPMTSAIWSSSAADAAGFPLSLFLRFFENHGLLQIMNRPIWRTVTGGSRCYVEAIAGQLGDRLRCATKVATVRRGNDGVEVRVTGRESERFDRVVFATHADETLRLLGDADQQETELLKQIPYRENDIVLHTDRSVLPNAPRAWSSWNYHVPDCEDPEQPLMMTYYLNRLQGFQSRTPFCVTLNDTGRIDPARVMERFRFAHPLYTESGLEARVALRRRNGVRATYFCGAYLGNGFHEDGVKSGCEAAHAIDPTVDPWR